MFGCNSAAVAFGVWVTNISSLMEHASCTFQHVAQPSARRCLDLNTRGTQATQTFPPTPPPAGLGRQQRTCTACTAWQSMTTSSKDPPPESGGTSAPGPPSSAQLHALRPPLARQLPPPPPEPQLPPAAPAAAPLPRRRLRPPQPARAQRNRHLTACKSRPGVV